MADAPASASTPVFANSAAVRAHLARALALDLIGPDPDSEHASELLGMPPQRWYISGFLVPYEAEEQRHDPESVEQVDLLDDERATDDGQTPEKASARKVLLPSSIGLSVLLPDATGALDVRVEWGDYRRMVQEGQPTVWQRTPRAASLPLSLPHGATPRREAVPDSGGLELVVTSRAAAVTIDGRALLPPGTRAVSVFLVNKRPKRDDDFADESFAFQARLMLSLSGAGFVPRPDLRMNLDEWDDRVARVQYRGAYEFAVGHGVSAHAVTVGEHCERVHTVWMPAAYVHRVQAFEVPGVEVGMEALAAMPDAATLQAALAPLPVEYREWIAAQRASATGMSGEDATTVGEMLRRAEFVARRIELGIARLSDARVFRAFAISQRAMAAAARRREAQLRKKAPDELEPPRWRTFQLAFLLMNLDGIADPAHDDRETVDLLFFPTGGGKTEAYLGLAAFTLVMRRLTHPGIQSAGVSVLMRYTLRLLTLDQLGRAAALICALELERRRDPATLGEWPFEVGLWVGQAATPNRLGRKGDDDGSAREKLRRFKADSSRGAPIPLENCPWCGEKFAPASFNLEPSDDEPRVLTLRCMNDRCDFTRSNPLPIHAVDEPIYRRLPCFLIATVDKFAALPWTGQTGALFGRVSRHDRDGFYGPCDPPTQGLPLDGTLPPPDLIIQDELHLISGPLGTMAGLYETVIEMLSTRTEGGRPIRPKIVASTATIRRASDQIRALFGRVEIEVFPPPGPDRRDSFFATTVERDDEARLYVGLAAQGRSPKVLLLRAFLALLAAAEHAYVELGGKRHAGNPADPYMTLVGYFNSLRELGGSRRIVEDEVSSRVLDYGARRREGEARGPFTNRRMRYEPRELTSRESTAKVSDTKRRLALLHADDDHVDVALATNMISVGLDILRLGLMAVFGQPKTSSEYIQATSRVGRDPQSPGLVATLLNVHKPRDRSHYERFESWHASFYRAVEVTSVTPFAPRAVDRGIAATTVALARLGCDPLVPAQQAIALQPHRAQLGFIATTLAERAARASGEHGDDLLQFQRNLEQRVADLLDSWETLAARQSEAGARFQYGTELKNVAASLLADPLARDLVDEQKKFRAGRSLRDVEPSVGLRVKTLDGNDLPVMED